MTEVMTAADIHEQRKASEPARQPEGRVKALVAQNRADTAALVWIAVAELDDDELALHNRALRAIAAPSGGATLRSLIQQGLRINAVNSERGNILMLAAVDADKLDLLRMLLNWDAEDYFSKAHQRALHMGKSSEWVNRWTASPCGGPSTPACV
ncbi:hypothetical protein [Hydrogenophaga sp.]|uniref:hypothetical protein n=1 Tax=Hydrogenophaga sp. TaxID=1904254 RepID=UPI00272551C7|nr:hypothetical protein [Hydrogenophaga sp.]MDO9437163.1 hypothetical protein [Hydrogenophaga sp.]